MSLRASSSCQRSTSTDSWSEWAWGSSAGRELPALLGCCLPGLGRGGQTAASRPGHPRDCSGEQQWRCLVLQRLNFPGAAADREGPGGPGASAEQPAGAATGLAGLRALGPPALAEPLPRCHRSAAAQLPPGACEPSAHGAGIPCTLSPMTSTYCSHRDTYLSLTLLFPGPGNQPGCPLLGRRQEVSPSADIRP